MIQNRLLVLIALGLCCRSLCAQGGDPPPDPAPAAEARPVPAAFNSPKATLLTFLEAMAEVPPDRDRGVECMDTSGVSRDVAPDLALKLHRCLNRIEFVKPEDQTLDEAGLREDEHRDRARWMFFPPQEDRKLPPYLWRSTRYWNQYEDVLTLAPEAEIVFARMPDGSWLFSAETVEGIEELWDRIQTLGPVSALGVEEYRTLAERFEQVWPAYLVETKFLSVKYWQWITLALLILVGMVLDFTIRFVITAIVRRVIARQGGEARNETIRKMVRPFGLFCAAIFWLWAVRLLGLPEAAVNIVMPAVRLFAMLATVWAAYRVTDLVSEVLVGKAEGTATKFDDLLIPLVRKTIKIFITVFGLIYIANSLDVPIAPLLTGLGIGGAGFAFAAKDTLEHFFGSVTVIIDRPFQVGDWVVIGDVEGTVEEVGFRSTRVRTFYNSLVTIPNGNLVRAVVDNYGQRKYRRWKTYLNLTYDTPPDKIEAFCEGVRELIRVHPYTRKDYFQCWLHQFGAHSLDVLVYMFHEAPDWQTELRERHRLMLDIIRLADQLGVGFAFPTQTLHLHQEDAAAVHTPAELPEERADLKAQLEGRRTVGELTAKATWRRVRPGPYVISGSGREDEDTQIESKVGGDA